mmetsp:Transcript_41974/g.94317  ORF Transcript_41974/g.94317 Transcript_41974/m.94317 type:complete len:237 (+) Transcript_41974:187-897(+)
MPRSQAQKSDIFSPLSWWSILGFSMQCLGLIGAIVAWCFFLECSPTASQIRTTMMIILVAVTVAELACCWLEYLNRWAAVVIMLANIWGGLDATLRFPTIVLGHPWCKFTAKLVVLWLVKLIGLIGSFVKVRENSMVLLGLMLVHVAFMPLMHLLSLPIGEDLRTQQCWAQDAAHEDLLVTLYRLCTNAASRHVLVQGMRRKARTWLLALASRSGWFTRVLCYLDPSYKRVLRTSV